MDRQDVQLTGVEVTPLAVIPGAFGSVMHVMKGGAPGYHGFGEAYFSTVEQGAVKGWKLHQDMVCNLVVPVGEVRFVIFDDRSGSGTRGSFQEFLVGPDERVSAFNEKPAGDGRWVNAGFFVCEPTVFDYIEGDDSTIFEREPLEKLAAQDDLVGYRHTGFWHCVDTLHDKVRLHDMWTSGRAPWRVWGES